MWLQKELGLRPRAKGFHLITEEIIHNLGEIKSISVGLLVLFLKHTSASLTINENASPSVRYDFENYFNRAVAEDEDYYTHLDEGSDDLPAHIKSSMLGVSLTIPVTKGELNLGIWQGIYLCEHRQHGGSRKLVMTLYGE